MKAEKSLALFTDYLSQILRRSSEVTVQGLMIEASPQESVKHLQDRPLWQRQ